MSGEINEVLEKIDIESYLDREGIEYRPTSGTRGPQFNLKECPVCGSDKWKVFLNQETGLGNCFSGDCGAKFNKWKFIAAHSGLGTKDLVEHLKAVAAEVGWKPKRKSVVAVSTESKELKIVTSYPIPIMGRNLAYLERRGITIDIAKYFHLRFCKKGWFKYQNDGQDRFMKFDMRIIIPVFDLDGNLVSFQGRDILGTAERKYLFPPGFASTGEHLYNGHNVHKTDRVLLGEGAFDVMAQKIALDEDPDLRDVVPIGSFGKHLSPNQLSKFLVLKERGVKQVTIMWDGELAAINDAIDAALQIRSLGLEARVACLPQDKDPNEVSGDVVRDAYRTATVITPLSAAKLKMKIRTVYKSNE